MKKARIGMIAAAVLLLCFAAWFALRAVTQIQELDYSATVTEYDLDDPGYAVSHELVIDGAYSYTDPGRKTFEGTLYLSDLDIPRDMRVKITFADSVGTVIFYDKAGQPITGPVYRVTIDADGRPILIELFDRYQDTGDSVQGIFYGRRFLCAETMSRQAAIELLGR